MASLMASRQQEAKSFELLAATSGELQMTSKWISWPSDCGATLTASAIAGTSLRIRPTPQRPTSAAPIGLLLTSTEKVACR